MPTLQDTKDPIVEELRRICENDLVTRTTFIHANLLEANFGLDQLATQEVNFPVFVHVATGRSKNKFLETGVIIREATVYGLLLEQVKNPTTDYDSEEVSQIINRMRQLGDNLAYYINRSPLSVNGGLEEWEAVDTYAKFDAHLFGQALSFTWILDSGATGYLNPSNLHPEQ